MPPQQSIVRQGPRSAQRQRSVLAELLIWSAAILAATCTVCALDAEALPGFQDTPGPERASERALEQTQSRPGRFTFPQARVLAPRPCPPPSLGNRPLSGTSI